MNLIDDISLSILAETGDIDLAERVEVAVRLTFEAVADMLASIGGLGPDFSAQMHLSL